jgi:predicted signal transduction protein with EAL and GGDEF domain
LSETDLAARLGGDEFALLYLGASGVAEVEALARRVRDVIAAPLTIEGKAVTLDASIGICMVPGDATNADQILLNADIALYRAKADGRGTYCFFQESMNTGVKKRRKLETELRLALDQEAFELHYQPIVDLNTMEIVTYEALLRWNHPAMGMIPPSEFIPIAEEAGVVTRLGAWVLARGCADAASWLREATVAINISPSHVTSPQFIGDVMRALAQSGLPPERLEVEITETVLMQDTDAALSALSALRALGVKLSLDDFGTGFSSLAYLGRFPFSKIKIDRSFIVGLPEEQSSHAIVKAITGLSEGLGLITTAEGVETESQLSVVLALGCTQVQGYLFGRAVDNDTLLRLMAAQADERALAVGGLAHRLRGPSAGMIFPTGKPPFSHVETACPVTE